MKTFIAHGRPLVRAGLRALILDNIETAEVVEVESFDDALAAAKLGGVDLFLLDLALPGLGGFEGLRTLRAALPDAPIVVVAGTENEADVSLAIDNGARGFIPEWSSAELFVNALRLVLSGNVYVPPSALRKSTSRDAAAPSPQAGSYRLNSLTPRQREVLALIAVGDSNKEMADKLGIAEGTIRIHVAAILKGLNLRNRTQAALLAVQSQMAS